MASSKGIAIIGVLVSSFREGLPMLSTVRSAMAEGVDFVYCLEAGIGDAPAVGDPFPVVPDEWLLLPRLTIEEAEPFEDDAAKRSHMLRRAKTIGNELGRGDDPLWLLWLDGDELLVWGDYLVDLCYRASFETGAGGFPLRIVELDGSVALSFGKVIRAENVTRYLHSSYQVELRNGQVVALPNVKICSSGGIPYIPNATERELLARQDELMTHHRPPLAGEPHLLHRSLLRSPERGAERQHVSESRWFRDVLGPDGQPISRVEI